MSTPNLNLSQLAQSSGYSERALRRAIERIQAEGGDLELADNQVSGADLGLLQETLADLRANYTPHNAPPIGQHLQNLRQRRSVAVGHISAPVTPAALKQGLDPGLLQQRLDQLEAKLDKQASLTEAIKILETKVEHLTARFNDADKALRAIGLMLQDEDADQNLYNIIISNIGNFNDRLTVLEATLDKHTSVSLGMFVKGFADQASLMDLLKELINEVKNR